MPKTKYVEAASDKPVLAPQRVFSHVPMVAIFTNTSTTVLESDINLWLAANASPLDDNYIVVVEVAYAGANVEKKQTEYSALIHYNFYSPV